MLLKTCYLKVKESRFTGSYLYSIPCNNHADLFKAFIVIVLIIY